jgi:hypothetical protein
MYRKLVPSRENSSLIIKSMGVEMIAGCILTPIMSMFSPGTYFTYLSYETLCENNKERKFNIFIFYVCVCNLYRSCKDYFNYLIVSGLSDTTTAEKILSEEPADWKNRDNKRFTEGSSESQEQKV